MKSGRRHKLAAYQNIVYIYAAYYF